MPKGVQFVTLGNTGNKGNTYNFLLNKHNKSRFRVYFYIINADQMNIFVYYHSFIILHLFCDCNI